MPKRPSKPRSSEHRSFPDKPHSERPPRKPNPDTRSGYSDRPGKESRGKSDRSFRQEDSSKGGHGGPRQRRSDENSQRPPHAAGAGGRSQDEYSNMPRRNPERRDAPDRRQEGEGRRAEFRGRDDQRSARPAVRGYERRENKEGSRPSPGRYRQQPTHTQPRGRKTHSEPETASQPMTLNKYLAHAGVSSRRDAAMLIKEGKVTVNGAVLNTPGYRVMPGDEVKLEGRLMKPQAEKVYIVLNKPKGFLTTTEDDRGRKTVMDLVKPDTDVRVFPVGRLDRNTTGVILFTNDGDLAQKLSHPSYKCRKIYHVTLDKNVTERDFQKIAEGIELEDGKIQVDDLAFLETKKEIGLEIHSGKNRIVRRIFESLGYEVEKLDRVAYANLTKKNVPRGKWRQLSEKEVLMLKHFKS